MSQPLRKTNAMSETNLNEFHFEKEPINDISEILHKGGTILYPTDTIWGIGCDATNPHAVEKIYALKQRDRDKPLSLLVSSIEMIKQYIGHLHPRIETLLSHHVRPLTVVYEGARNLPANLVAKDGSIAMRIPQNEFCRQLIHHFGKPITSTSANLSGASFPTHFGAISLAIVRGVDYVVRQRQKETEPGQPSVIIKAGHNGEITFLRE